MSEDAIRQVAEGRVWTGATAKELGLVDQLGGINEALKAASEKAGLEHYTVADYPEETDPFTALLQKGKDEYINARLRKNTGEFYHYLHVIQRLKQASSIQAHMGFYPNI